MFIGIVYPVSGVGTVLSMFVIGSRRDSITVLEFRAPYTSKRRGLTPLPENQLNWTSRWERMFWALNYFETVAHDIIDTIRDRNMGAAGSSSIIERINLSGMR